MTSYATEGERLVGRTLKRDQRAGVDHYVPGQHHAEIVAEGAADYVTHERSDIARLTYVSAMGNAVVVLCCRPSGGVEWTPTWIGSAGQVTRREPVKAPASFELSASMLSALAEARLVSCEADA